MRCASCNGTGYLYPVESNGNTDRPWVERCDDCGKFPDDMSAATAAAAVLGLAVKMGRNPDAVSPLWSCPYLEAV